MTVATFHTQQDMLNPYVWFGSVTVFTGTQWTATDGVHTGTYTGTNFQYGGSTGKKLISGTITGYQESKNGSLSLNITGLSADVATLNSSIYSSDALGADKYMYRGSDTINGSTGDDTIVGYDGADQLYGNNGNDVIIGETGNDKLDGGTGIDIARYSAVSSGFTVSKSASGFTVTDNKGVFGTDALVNVERIQFADKTIALDVSSNGNAGKTLEFIGMMAHSLAKTPTVVGTILSIFDQGKSMKEVCQLAIDVGLTKQLAGSTSNLDLAKLVFRNVVGSDANASNAANLASFIQGNGGSMTQADFLTAVAQLDLNNQHIGLVGLQSTGVEYII